AVNPPRPYLYLGGSDAIGRGDPAGQAVPDDQRQSEQRPHRVAGGRTQHQRADQYRDLPQQLVNRMHQQHAGAEPLPRLPGFNGHVASSPPRAAMSVSCATTRSATWASSATMRTAPADDAVVTVTLASPNSWSSGPRSVSTVCTREIGPIRRSCTSQPVRVYTAFGPISQRCTRYRHNGTTTTNSTMPSAVAAAGSVCTHNSR